MEESVAKVEIPEDEVDDLNMSYSSEPEQDSDPNTKANKQFDELRTLKFSIGKSWSELSSVMEQYHAKLVAKHTEMELITDEDTARTRLFDLEEQISNLENKLLAKDSEVVSLRTEVERLSLDLSIKDGLIDKLQNQMSRESNDYQAIIDSLHSQMTKSSMEHSAALDVLKGTSNGGETDAGSPSGQKKRKKEEQRPPSPTFKLLIPETFQNQLNQLQNDSPTINKALTITMTTIKPKGEVVKTGPKVPAPTVPPTPKLSATPKVTPTTTTTPTKVTAVTATAVPSAVSLLKRAIGSRDSTPERVTAVKSEAGASGEDVEVESSPKSSPVVSTSSTSGASVAVAEPRMLIRNHGIDDHVHSPLCDTSGGSDEVQTMAGMKFTRTVGESGMDEYYPTEPQYDSHGYLKRYVACSVCRKFIRSNEVLSHNRKHLELSPFKCTLCDKRFCDAPSGWKHVRYKHKLDEIEQYIQRIPGAP